MSETMSNAQVALMAASAKKYSISSFKNELDQTLEAADRYMEWLAGKDRAAMEPPPTDTSWVTR